MYLQGGGTWDYTNKGGIKQYEGSYSGDIAAEGANNLSLTLEKAADESGKLLEVTEPQSFDFAVSSDGKFEATIPAVEIAVPVGPTEVELIKTATMENTFDMTVIFRVTLCMPRTGLHLPLMATPYLTQYQ